MRSIRIFCRFIMVLLLTNHKSFVDGQLQATNPCHTSDFFILSAISRARAQAEKDRSPSISKTVSNQSIYVSCVIFVFIINEYNNRSFTISKNDVTSTIVFQSTSIEDSLKDDSSRDPDLVNNKRCTISRSKPSDHYQTHKLSPSYRHN